MPTSIQVEKETKKRLDKFKNHPRETYNEVLSRMIHMLSQQNKEELSQQTIKNIRKSLNDIEKGKVYSLEQVEQELGL